METLVLLILGGIIYLVLFHKYKCPKCGGEMEEIFFDTEINKEVYRCKRCKEKFVLIG